MDKLAAYSDEEEEETSFRQNVEVKASDQPKKIGVGQEKDSKNEDDVLKSSPSKTVQSSEGGSQANGTLAQVKRSPIEASPITSSSRASTSKQILDPDDNVLYVLGPPPRVLSDGSIDAEWGLGVENRSGQVDETLYNKLAHFHRLKEEQGTHFNQSLNRNRSFRNPHIYSKLVQWVEVEETGSGYPDMVRGGRTEADRAWMSSSEARAELKKQGGKDAIASLQRRRQEESDERKRKSRRDNINFVGSSTKISSPAAPTSSTYDSSSNSRSKAEALALVEIRAQKIRDEMMAARGSSSSGRDDAERRRMREDDKDRHRSHHPYHRDRR